MIRLLIAICLLLAIPVASGMTVLNPPSNGRCIQGVTQPAPAAVPGLNCLVIYETWPSSSVIDGSDTRNPGFNWYTHNGDTQTPPGTVNAGGWAFGLILPTPLGDWSWTTPGQVSMSPAAGTIGNYNGLPVQFMSCAQQGTGTGLVGTVFGPGFYADVKFIQFSTDSPFGTWNIAWGVPTTMLNGGVGSNWLVFEPDILEWFNGTGFDFAYHDWSGSGSTVNFNNSYGTPFLSPNPGDTVGLLQVPSAFNSGTNKVERYLNDVLVAHSTCTSTGTALATCDGSTSGITLTDINTNQYCLALAAGAGSTPGIFGKVQVWAPN